MRRVGLEGVGRRLGFGDRTLQHAHRLLPTLSRHDLYRIVLLHPYFPSQCTALLYRQRRYASSSSTWSWRYGAGRPAGRGLPPRANRVRHALVRAGLNQENSVVYLFGGLLWADTGAPLLLLLSATAGWAGCDRCGVNQRAGWRKGGTQGATVTFKVVGCSDSRCGVPFACQPPQVLPSAAPPSRLCNRTEHRHTWSASHASSLLPFLFSPVPQRLWPSTR
jgi:hypothetical protein